MKKIWEKVKQIKHWEIYAAVIVVVVMLGIYLSSIRQQSNQSKSTEQLTTITNTENTYASQLEGKLQNVMSCIAGAGRVAVMVMTDGEGTAELAYDVQEKTITQTGANAQEVTTTTIDKTVVTKNGSPLTLWTNPPKILGIIVVATGASDVGVRLNLLEAVQTLIGEKQIPIQILSGI
jgi:stage III sporulation protein AG